MLTESLFFFFEERTHAKLGDIEGIFASFKQKYYCIISKFLGGKKEELFL